MSKAEEKAMQYCCAKCVHDKFGCSMKVLYHGENCIKCGNYIKGYHQAEKDLELTVDDIMKLDALLIEMRNRPTNEDKYQEVLKRFLKESEENDTK